LRDLEDRRAAILNSITEQNKLTPELELAIKQADTKQRLEDLYAPFKVKRRTRAQIAREAGLEPLADGILADVQCDPLTLAAQYLNTEAGIADAKAALDGARDILAEGLAENADLLGRLRGHMKQVAKLVAKVVDGKEAEGAKFSDYFAHSEGWAGAPSHRVLAMLRGRNEGFLSLDLEVDADAPRGESPAERGQAEAIARNLIEMSRLKVPMIVVIIGEGASGGALGIGIGDKVLMLENTWYSVISPESCSSILWRSWDYKEQAAEALKLTAKDMKANGLVDDIIPEPLGGAHKDIKLMARTIKQVILNALKELDAIEADERIEQRIEKFCAMGVVVE
jgi:hypothetical protein